MIVGKTTLLNVLNYRNRGNLLISGDVKVNGQVVKSRDGIAAISGYVQQDDLFIGFLKVKEQLKFQVILFKKNDQTIKRDFYSVINLIGYVENEPIIF
jgi:ABC-type multidrug transport system ATPase subunit